MTAHGLDERDQPDVCSLRRAAQRYERIVNYLAEIEGAQVGGAGHRTGGGASTKFSLRSVAPYDVARDVAQPLGGGGHERAAGVTISLPLEEALAKVLDRARKML